MKRLLLLAIASLSLTACATDGIQTIPQAPPAASIPSGATPISEAAQKALYAAEAAYNIPADAYVRLNASGRLTPALKAQAKPVLLQAYNGLKLARQAAAAGDTVGVMLQTAEATRLAKAAQALLPAQ